MRNIPGFSHGPTRDGSHYLLKVYRGSLQALTIETKTISDSNQDSMLTLGVFSCDSGQFLIVRDSGYRIGLIDYSSPATTHFIQDGTGTYATVGVGNSYQRPAMYYRGSNLAVIAWVDSAGRINRAEIALASLSGDITYSSLDTYAPTFSSRLQGNAPSLFLSRERIGVVYIDGISARAAIISAANDPIAAPTGENISWYKHPYLGGIPNEWGHGSIAIDASGNAVARIGTALQYYDAAAGEWAWPYTLPAPEVIYAYPDDICEFNGKFIAVSCATPQVGKQNGIVAWGFLSEIFVNGGGVPFMSPHPDGYIPMSFINTGGGVLAFVSLSIGGGKVFISGEGQAFIASGIPHFIGGHSATLVHDIAAKDIESFSIGSDGTATFALASKYTGSIAPGDVMEFYVDYGTPTVYGKYVATEPASIYADIPSGVEIPALHEAIYKLRHTTALNYTEIVASAANVFRAESGKFYQLEGSGVAHLSSCSLDLWGAKPKSHSQQRTAADVTNKYGAHEPTVLAPGSYSFYIPVPGDMFGNDTEAVVKIYGHTLLSDGSDNSNPDAYDFAGTMTIGVVSEDDTGSTHTWHINGSWPYVYTGKIPCYFKGANSGYDASGSYPLEFAYAAPAQNKITGIYIDIDVATDSIAFYIERIEISNVRWRPQAAEPNWALADGVATPEPKNGIGIMLANKPMSDMPFSAVADASLSFGSIAPSVYGGEGRVGIAFWVQDIYNYHVVYYNGSSIVLARIVDGQQTTLSSTAKSLASTDFKIGVKHIGGTLSAVITDNGIVDFSTPDVAYTISSAIVIGDKIGLYYANTCQAFRLAGAIAGSQEIGIVPGEVLAYAGSGKLYANGEYIQFGNIVSPATEYGPFQVRNVNYFPAEFNDIGQASPAIETAMCRWDTTAPRPSMTHVYFTPGYYATVDSIEWRPKYAASGNNAYRRDRNRMLSTSIDDSAYTGVNDRAIISKVLTGVVRESKSSMAYGKWAILAPDITSVFRSLAVSYYGAMLPTVHGIAQGIAGYAGCDIDFDDRRVGDLLNGVLPE